MSTVIDIADAVAASLNVGSFALPFTAVRKYVPAVELSDLADLNVTVINYLSNQAVEGVEVLLLNEGRGIKEVRVTDARGTAVFQAHSEVRQLVLTPVFVAV